MKTLITVFMLGMVLLSAVSYGQNQLNTGPKSPVFINELMSPESVLITLGTQQQQSETGEWWKRCSPNSGAQSMKTIKIIYTADEIKAAGGTAGYITSLAWDVSEVNGINLTNYRIILGHTSYTNVQWNVWPEDSTNVKYAHTYTPGSTGWRTITFDKSFFWDGTRNILVWMCNEAGSGSWNGRVWLYQVGTPNLRSWHSNCRCECAVYSFTDGVGGKPRIQFNLDPVPNLTVTPSSLNFGNVLIGETSAEQTYTLAGTTLSSSPITVTAPAGYEVSLTSGSGFTTSVDVTFTPPTLASKTIYVRFKPTAGNIVYSGNVTNAGGGATTKNVAVTGTSYYYLKWCTSTANNTANEDIFNVTLSSISNSSNCNTTGPDPGSVKNRYSNYTVTVPTADIQREGVYPFNVQIGTCGSNSDNATKIFIDYNSDGDFSDAGEEVYVSPASTSGAHTETGNITIPVDAALGITMLRIVNVATSTPSFITPCGTYEYGETEDYLVNITTATAKSLSEITYNQASTSVAPNGSVNQEILRLDFSVTGSSGTLPLNSIVVTSNNTNDADITNVKLFRTLSSVYNTSNQLGTTQTFSGGAATFSSLGAELAPGNNFIWIAYDISPTPTDGNTADAKITANNINVGGSTYPPTDESPAGGRVIRIALSGEKTIGTGGDYASITDAINILNVTPISGHITYRLLNSNYNTGTGETFPITINSIATDAGKTITFKPGIGVTTIISGDNSGGIIKLNGCDYVAFDGSNSGGTDRNLTIENTSTGYYSFVIGLENNGGSDGAKNCTIKNMNIKSNANNTIGINLNGTGGDYDNILIQNNKIYKCYYGILFSGGSGTGIINDGQIINNIIGDASEPVTYRGIQVDYADNTMISGNEIFGQIAGNSNTSQAGIYLLSGTSSSKIRKNKIHDFYYNGSSGYGTWGIYFETYSSATETEISNNVIYAIKSDGDQNPNWSPSGIYIPFDGNVNIYNNSIYMYGDVLGNYNGWSSCISIGPFVSLLNIRNNVLRNSMGRTGGTPSIYAIFAESNNSVFTNIDYNDYYVTDQPNVNEYIGYLDNTNRTTFANWKAATGKDNYSVSCDPAFTSLTNLLPDVNNACSWSIANDGAHIAGITEDINGTARPTINSQGTPDLGAYEFGNPVPAPLPITLAPVPGSNIINIDGKKIIDLNFGNLGGISGIEVKFYPGKEPPSGGFRNTTRYMNGYYTVTQTGGSGYAYDIKFFYSECQLGSITSENNIRLAKTDDNGVTWVPYLSAGTGQGQYELNTDENYVKVYGLSSFSHFTLTDSDSPLPVNLESFTYRIAKQDVDLNWVTSLETNNSGFEIERKPSGTNAWNKIGFIEGKNTNPKAEYKFTDRKLNYGKYNYRLKQIDYNGNYGYYELNGTIEIGLPQKYNISQNYPNPFNPVTKIDYDLPFDSKVLIIIYDVTGREMKRLVNNELKQGGYYTIEYNGSKLSSGVYFYRMIAEGGGKEYIMTKKMALIK